MHQRRKKQEPEGPGSQFKEHTERHSALSCFLVRLFDPDALVELTSAIAWENYRARFDHALKLGAQGFSDGAFCPLPDRRSNPRAATAS